ncbi:24842_t:CDS:2 [Dentiscutata erythropus]|uniref:24842_t:CDS:1 n=1 Tax=Dentiscutata erythropus TaxID=1348616 RepID=A0A9N9EP05_9GLOM|nr:24842_t:CDS:2 [Dentiscutata erythropus]
MAALLYIKTFGTLDRSAIPKAKNNIFISSQELSAFRIEIGLSAINVYHGRFIQNLQY